MLVLLPFYLIGLAADIFTCTAMAYSGARFACMLVVLFIAYTAAALALFVVLLFAVTSCADTKKPQQRQDKFFRFLINLSYGVLIGLMRIRLHVSGEENFPKGRWLLVSNHRSNLDPIVTGWALRKRELAFISKPENFKIPIAGALARKNCYLSLEREDDRSALKTIIAATDYIKKDVVSIAIYPEGTRNPTDTLLPFRNGAFKIAQRAKAPIVVMTVKNTEKVARNFPFRHTDIYLSFSTVIDRETVEALNTAEIGDLVRRSMICETCGSC